MAGGFQADTPSRLGLGHVLWLKDPEFILRLLAALVRSLPLSPLCARGERGNVDSSATNTCINSGSLPMADRVGLQHVTGERESEPVWS